MKSIERRILVALARAVGSPRRTVDILQKLADELVDHYGMKFVAVTTFDDGQKNLRVVAHSPEKNIAELMASSKGFDFRKDVRFLVPSTAGTHRVRGSKPRIGKDLTDVLSFRSSTKAARAFQKQVGIRSYVRLPLSTGGHLIGMLLIAQKEREFSDEQLGFFSDVAMHVSLVLYEIRMHELNAATAKRLELLTEIDKEFLRQEDPYKVIQVIVRHAQEFVACDWTGIFLYNPQKKKLESVLHVGADLFEGNLLHYSVPIGKGIVGWVAKTRKPRIVNNAHRHPRSVYPSNVRPEQEHLISIPLLAGDVLLGVMHFARFKMEPFVPAELEAAQLFAEKSALAVANAQLIRQHSERAEHLRSLQHINTQIAHSLDLPTVLDNIIREAVQLVPEAQRGTVLLLDESRQDLYVAAAYGYSPEFKESFRLNVRSGYGGRAVRERRSFVIKDATKLPPLPQAAEFPESTEVKSAIVIPLILQEEIFGVISLDNVTSVGALTQKELVQLELFASNAAVALANARLHASVQREVQKIRILKEIKELSHRSLSETQFYQEVLAKVVQAFDFAYAVIMLADNEQRMLRVAALAGKYEEHLLPIDDQSFDVGVMGWVVRHRIPRLVNDTSREAMYVSPRVGRLNSELCVPILLSIGEVHGCINIESKHLRAFTESDLHTLQAIATEIADAVEERRLSLSLVESEEKYRSLVEESLIGVYLIQDNTFRFVNKRMAEMFGYQSAEIIDRLSVADLVAPESRQLVLENVRRRLEGEVKSLRYSFSGLRKDGVRIDAEVHGSVSMYRGRPCVLGTIIDRTLELRTQHEANEWKKRYDLIVASSGQVAYDYDLVTGAIVWSGSIKRVLGYALEEMHGGIRQWEELIHPDDAPFALKLLEEAMQNVLSYDVEYRFKKKDGRFIWIHDRGFFVKEEDGTVRRMLGLLEDVDAQKELQVRLQSSERKYRLLVDNSSDAVFIMRSDRFIDCNAKALEMFGCQRHDIVGQPPYTFSPPHQPDGQNSKEKAIDLVAKATQGEPQKFYWRHIRLDGFPFEAEVRLNRLEYEGEVLLQAQVRDVTAQLEAEQNLRNSEANYRLLVQEAAEAILVSDGDGQFVEVNDRACELFGYTREEFLRKAVPALHLNPQEAMAIYHSVYRRLISEGSVNVRVENFRRNNGTVFPAEVNMVVLANGMLQAIVRDVSEQREAEGELDNIFTIAATLRGEELFERASLAISQLLEVPIVLIGFRNANLEAFDVHVCAEHGTIVKNVPCEGLEGLWHEVTHGSAPIVVQKGAPVRYPSNALIRTHRLESLLAVPMTTSRGRVNGCIVALSDAERDFTEHERKIVSIISQRLASEEELLQQQDRERSLSRQLMQAQKMDSLGRLAGGVAHDFNNILGAILGFTTLIHKTGSTDEKQLHYLEAIEKSANRAASLSRQLLSFAQGSDVAVQTLSINDLVSEAVHILEGSFPKLIRIVTELGDNVPTIEGNAGRLSQVLLNICINARDAMMQHQDNLDGDELHLSTTVARIDEQEASTRVGVKPGEYVKVTIRDTGVGMSGDLQQRIFEPFFTTKEKGQGTGLGLSVAYGIVRDHHGFIVVESEIGNGSTFEVFLPVMNEGAMETTTIESPSVPLPHGHGETILVVDDEPLIRDMCEEILTTHGFLVLSVGSGTEAVQQLIDGRYKIDLVLLDMMMPGMDGAKTFEMMKNVRPEIRVVFMSGMADEHVLTHWEEEGAAGFMSKPFRTEALLRHVSMALQGKAE